MSDQKKTEENREQPVIFFVIPCYDESEQLPITAPVLQSKIGAMKDDHLIAEDSRVLFVDDGSNSLEASLGMLREEIAQGVETVVCTPHLRTGYFEKSDETVLENFNLLKKSAEESGLKINLYHGREVFYKHSLFMKLLEEINEKGTTVIVVTHNLEIVKVMKKRVITVKKGVIVSDSERGDDNED